MKSGLYKIPACGILLVSVLLTTGFIIRAMNKGFDITDEGFYLLSYQDNYEVQYFSSFYNYFVRGFFGWLDLNIITIRIIRLLLTIVSSFILAVGVYRFSYSKSITFTDITSWISFFIIVLASYSSYSFGPQSLSYNTLSQVMLQFAGGFLLIFLANFKLNKTRKAVIYIALTGVFIAFLLPIKITTFGLTGLGTALLVAIYPYKKDLKTRVLYLFCLMFGVIIGGLLISIFVINPLDLYEGLSKAAEIQLEIPGYTKENLLKSSINAFKSGFKLLLLPLFFIAGYFVFTNKTDNKVLNNLKTILLFLSVILAFYIFFQSHFFNGAKLVLSGWSEPFFQISAFFILFAIVGNIIDKRNFLKLGIDNTIVILFLLSLPLFGVFGTNNDFFTNAIFFVAFWIAPVLIIVLRKPFPKAIMVVFLIIFPLITIYYLDSKLIKNPYRGVDLNKNDTKLEGFTNVKGIYVNKEYAVFLTGLKQLLEQNGYKKGDDIIGIYKIPGLIYLLEANSPGGVLWSEKHSAFYFANLSSGKGFNTPVIITTETPSEAFLKKLEQYKIYFPDRYKQVGEIKYEKSYKVYFPKK